MYINIARVAEMFEIVASSFEIVNEHYNKCGKITEILSATTRQIAPIIINSVNQINKIYDLSNNNQGLNTQEQ